MSVLKKIIILCCIVVINFIDGAQREYEAYDKRDELISFKKLAGFPLVSWDNANKWDAKLSAQELQNVRKQIKWRKDKRLATLFHMRALPQDIKRLIAAHVFKSETADYKNAADIFCKKPLCDVFQQYALSTQIFNNPKNFSFVKECPFGQHVFFEYAHDLIVYQDVMKIGFSNFRLCSKKELAMLAKVDSVFGPFIEQNEYYKYQFRNKITFDRIKQACKECFVDQALLLPVVISAYVFLMFPLRRQRVRNQGNIDYNSAASDLNEAIKVFNDKVRYLRQITGSDYEYRSYTGWKEEESIIWHGAEYKKWSGALGGTWVSFLLGLKSREIDLAVSNFSEKNSSQRVRSILATFFGLCGVYTVMASIAAQCEENSWYGVGYVTGLYALLCSCYNIYKVQRVQSEYVSLKNIPALLQRTDIEIV